MSGHGKTIKQCKNKTMMMITVKDTVNSGQKEKQLKKCILHDLFLSIFTKQSFDKPNNVVKK